MDGANGARVNAGGFRVPAVHQLGFVVQDVDRALDELSVMFGIRRWYRPVNKAEPLITYRGRRVACTVEFVLGFAGRTQVEVITTQGEANIFSDFLAAEGPGLHHLCFFVTNYDRALAHYRAEGYQEVQTGVVESKGGSVTRFCYLQPRDGEGNGTAVAAAHGESQQSAATRTPARSPIGMTIELSEARLASILPIRMTPFMMRVGVLTGDLVEVGKRDREYRGKS